MSLWSLILRSLWQRPLSSALTIISVALGVMLVVTILSVQAEVEKTYRRQGTGFSIVVGPTGSPLELVLNSIYHTGQSSGLMPYSAQRELEGEEWKRFVRVAVPYALGDSYRGYRVVATTDALFSEHFPVPPGAGQAKFDAGGPFAFDRDELDRVLDALRRDALAGLAPGKREAVLGHEAARSLGLGVGDRFAPTHGVEGDHAHAEGQEWQVRGVLKETGSPIDRVVFINLDSFYRIAEHAGGRMPISGEPAISSILVFPRGGYAKAVVLANLKKRSDLQVADVPTEIGRLLKIVGNIDRLLFLMAIAVLIVGLLSVTVAIYNTMNERRREIAIMRAIGARRRDIFVSVVGEAGLLAAAGALLGYGLARILLFLAAEGIAETSGLALGTPGISGRELLVLVAVVAAGALAGMIPAWKAYRTDVAANLAPLS